MSSTIDKTQVNEKLAQLAADTAALVGIPGITDYIGVVLEWQLRQTDHLLMVVLESLLEDV